VTGVPSIIEGIKYSLFIPIKGSKVNAAHIQHITGICRNQAFLDMPGVFFIVLLLAENIYVVP
jgi:hypothetical protein